MSRRIIVRGLNADIAIKRATDAAAAAIGAAAAAATQTAAAVRAQVADLVTDAQTARTGSEAARSDAQGFAEDARDISNIATPDGLVRALVDDPASQTRAGLTATVAAATAAPAGVLSRVWKARQSQMIMAIYGMSITSFDYSPMQVAAAQLRTLHGAVGEFFERFGALGGSYTEPSLGWNKQWYGGQSYVRLVGTSASTAIARQFYGDTLWLSYSDEADAGSFTVTDETGSTLITTTTAGVQQYGKMVKVTLPRGPHTVTFNPPASGKAYPEWWLGFDSTRPGIIVLDFTMGGTLLWQMRNLGTPAGGMIAGIPVVGDNGIKAHFDRDDIDGYLLGQDVNDAGSFKEADFATILGICLNYCDTRARPIMLQSAMAGHYANPTDSGFASFAAIKATLRRETLARPYVTLFDWDTATRMPAAKVTDGTYQARYYGPVDFIHPLPLPGTAYSIGLDVICRLLSIPTPAQPTRTLVNTERVRRPGRPPARRTPVTTRTVAGESYTITASTDLVKTSRPHGLLVGDAVYAYAIVGGLADWGPDVANYVTEVPSATEFKVSLTSGGTSRDFTSNFTVAQPLYRQVTRSAGAPAGYGLMAQAPGAVGQGYGPASWQHVPVFADRDVANLQLDYTATIAASTTEDSYGKYKDLSAGANLNFGRPTNAVCMVALRVAGPLAVLVQGAMKVCAPDGSFVAARPAGTPDYDRVAIGGSSVTEDPEPYVALIPVRTPGGGLLTVTASRVYAFQVVYGNLGVLTA